MTTSNVNIRSVELSIVPFKFCYLEDLLEMHKSQKYLTITDINMRTLPKVGFIAYLGKQPIAAGFLRRVEPCFAQLDTLVSNAHFGSAIRNQGVSAVVDALISEAKHLKLEGILATTQDTGTLERAVSLGFKVLDSHLIVLALE